MNVRYMMRGAASVIMAAVMLLLCACEVPTFSDVHMENPKLAIKEFVECMSDKDFEEAEKLVGNYSTMGFELYEQMDKTSLDWRIFEMIFESYDVKFKNNDFSDISSHYESNDMSVSGKTALVTFGFTHLDFEKMSVTLSEEVTRVGAERMYDGEVYEDEEAALALVDEVFETIFNGDMSDYYTTEEITLEMAHMDGGWKLIISEEFYDALMGN